MERDRVREELDQITRLIMGAAIEVHRTIGPGLLESAYERCLTYELIDRGATVEVQKELPLIYKGIELNAGYRLDLLVDRKVIVEIKAVDRLIPVHQAQLLSYLKLSGLKVGLLMNFNVKILKDGVQRVVHNY